MSKNANNSSAQSQSNYRQRREELKKLSIALRKLIKEEAIDAATVNQALIAHYSDDENTEFKTFRQWKKSGKSIIKGSKAFVVWASPQDIPHPDPKEEDDEFKYFPLCYFFSNDQVTERSQS